MTTDYAIRIVCYMAEHKKYIPKSELSKQLGIPDGYVPKVLKKIKDAGLICSLEGVNGGYGLAKSPCDISLMEVVSCTESMQAINACLEPDGYCSRNAQSYCLVRKELLNVQSIVNKKLDMIKISDLTGHTKEHFFGDNYTILEVNLHKGTYQTLYCHNNDVFHSAKDNLYSNFVDHYVCDLAHPEDQKRLQEFLNKLDGNTSYERNFEFRRRVSKESNSYVWMYVNKYVDRETDKAIVLMHTTDSVFSTFVRMDNQIQQNEERIRIQYWNMVELLVNVLNHNNLLDSNKQDKISFYARKVYERLQKNYPELHITDEDIDDIAHLAPIHDIGKVQIPIEILNKKGKLTKEEFEKVKQHPVIGAEMTKRFPKSIATDKLIEYSYNICLYHHERYDGLGYPDGLKGEEIPLCAQVVGIVDAYDALTNVRPYKEKYSSEKAIRMILNGECGAFSNRIIRCFLQAAMTEEWMNLVVDKN